MSHPRFRLAWPRRWALLVDRVRLSRWVNASRLGALGRRPPRWVLITALTLFALVSLGSLAAFWVARSSIRNLEQRFHASIDLGPVLPCGLGVCLHNVTVRFGDAPGLTVDVAKARLQLALRREPRDVTIDGARATWKGTPAEVEAQARALSARWAHAKAQGNVAPGGTAGTAVRVANASFVWQAPEGGDSVRARGLELEKVGGDVRLFAEEGHASLGKRLIALSRGRAYLRREGEEIRFVSADAHELRLDQVGGATEADSTVVPTLTPGATGGAMPTEADEGPWSKAAALRAAMPSLRAALTRLEMASVGDAKVSVDAFYATFQRGATTVHLGPNAVNAFRTPTSFRFEMTPQGAERGPAALKLGVEVPTDVGHDIQISLRGGPVPLGAVGMRTGDLGLLDVEHSLVEADVSARLTGDGRRASAEVDAKVHNLSVEHRAVSSEPVRGAELRLRGDVVLETDGSAVAVERGELGVGAVRLAFSVDLRRPGPSWALRARVEVPTTPCQAALDALPAGLAPIRNK